MRVRDIGQAVAGPEDVKQAAWANGQRGVFLVIFKQPGANVIDTVDRIKAELPRITASLPAGIKVQTLSDRTQTIRASVEDVQFTLLITIALVVMVIFVFLRSLWATIIPSVTVPLALLGACALMWMAGYTLDNLSLMALTIAVGFVVDDAIVVLENIARYVEEGMKPMQAALKGAGEIGFTIVSISVSLIAVLIPLLLMGGIIGRLFREFAVVLSMTIGVSAFVSLSLTPMMASRFLKEHKAEHHGRLYRWSERLFDGMLHAYESALDVALRHHVVTFLTFLGTLALTGYLFVVIPKGFFPQQDTGLIVGITEGGQDVSFAAMEDRQRAVGAVIQADPDVASIAMSIGGSGQALNSGRMFITLKPRTTARPTPSRSSTACGRSSRSSRREGLPPGLAGRADRRARLAHPVRVHVAGPEPRRAQHLVAAPPGEAEDAAGTARRRHRPADRRHHPDADDQPRRRLALRHHAASDRRHALRRDRPAPGGAVLYPAQQLPRHHGDPAGAPGQPGFPAQHLREVAHDRRTGAARRLRDLDHRAGAAALDQPPGPVPRGDDQLQPRAERRAGQATAAIDKAAKDLGVPATLATGFQGTAQAFQQSLSTVPLLIVAALVVVYLILGILYESYIHPLTILSTLPSAGVGALAMLLWFGYDFSLIALIGIILLIGIVKKNGIMLVDFAIVAERTEGIGPEEAIRKAALALPPDPDDHDGGLARRHPADVRHRHRLGDPPAARYAMVGGLAVSQVLTLFTTPVIYIYLDKLASYLSGRSHGPEAKEDDAPEEGEAPSRLRGGGVGAILASRRSRGAGPPQGGPGEEPGRVEGGQGRVAVVEKQRQFGASQDDGVAARFGHAGDDALAISQRLRCDAAANQFIHDEAADFDLLRLARPAVIEPARCQGLRVDLAGGEPARAGDGEVPIAAPLGLQGDDLGDVKPGERRARQNPWHRLMDVLSGQIRNVAPAAASFSAEDSINAPTPTQSPVFRHAT